MGEGPLYRSQVGRAAHHCHARAPQPARQYLQVNHVESAERQSIEKDQVDLRQELPAQQEPGNLVGRVPSITSDGAEHEPFEPRTGAHGPGDPDGSSRPTREGPIVEADGAKHSTLWRELGHSVPTMFPNWPGAV